MPKEVVHSQTFVGYFHNEISVVILLLLDSWCRDIMSTVISNYILPTKEESQARTGHKFNFEKIDLIKRFSSCVWKLEEVVYPHSVFLIRLANIDLGVSLSNIQQVEGRNVRVGWLVITINVNGYYTSQATGCHLVLGHSGTCLFAHCPGI